MNTISFSIFGIPIAKKRPRFFRRGGFVGTYNCQETEEGRFMLQLQDKKPPGVDVITGPIELTLCFYMPISKSTTKKVMSKIESGEYRHTKKPDLDNLLKFFKDCANGVLWKDDSQVFRVICEKLYDNNPRTEVLLFYEDA